MIDENVVLQTENNQDNQEEEQPVRDEGFIDFYYHRLFITAPPHIVNQVINPSQTMRYLGLHTGSDIGDRFEHIMQDLLLFNEKKSITIPPVEELLKLKNISLNSEELYDVLDCMFFNQACEPDDLGLLFFSQFRNHYDYVQALGYLGQVLEETGRTDITELTYDKDLEYILAFIAYSNELVNYKQGQSDPYYHRVLPSNDVVQIVREIIQRVVDFRRRYEQDNATLPFGNFKTLHTNLARFMYRYHLPTHFDIDDEALTESERKEKEQQLMMYHRDDERDLRKYMRIYVGDYSVIYNPLLNKMFLWDYSREHMKDL